MSIPMSHFKAELSGHLEQIERLCKARNVPMSKITLLLRDPDNDKMIVLLTNETPESLEYAYRLATEAEVVA